jgi:hypothetical protein
VTSPITPTETLPDWLERIRANAEDAREYIDHRINESPYQSAREIDFAYGGLTGTVLTALNELARPEPDTDYLRSLLMGGYANSEAVRGKLDAALDLLLGIDATRARLASGHYLVRGEFWQGRHWDNRCACGREFIRGGAPCMSGAEAHVRVMARPNVNSSECDCHGDREAIPVWDGRCSGCGAVLDGSALASRKGAA